LNRKTGIWIGEFRVKNGKIKIMNYRNDLRNIAIIAHVDHGKTTLVDGLLKQSKVFRENQQTAECIMDSNALERERGITILAKNTAVTYRGVKINIIDTPGHADFGGEVERVINMADGCLLLIDAVDGPMPQTKVVLRKALEKKIKPIVVINKIDRENARIPVVMNMVQDLFLELAISDDQLDFPVIYASGREGWASLDPDVKGSDLSPLFETILKEVPPPVIEEGPFQMLVSNLDYDTHKGKIAIGRIWRGKVAPHDRLVVLNADGSATPFEVGQVFTHLGLKREEVTEASAGDIIAITGMDKSSPSPGWIKQPSVIPWPIPKNRRQCRGLKSPSLP
jgi:GTP-binding protein